MEIPITVLDEDGGPVSGRWVNHWAWYGDSIVPDVFRGFLTDSAGRVTLVLEDSVRTPPDSIWLEPIPDPCRGLGLIRATILPGEFDTGVDLVVPRSRKLRLAVGEGCGNAPRLIWSGHPLEFSIQLRFDTLGPLIKGRWAIHYQETRPSDVGQFTGVRLNEFLVLELVPEQPSSGCTRTIQLVGLLTPGDTIAEAQLQNGSPDCFPSATMKWSSGPFLRPFGPTKCRKTAKAGKPARSRTNSVPPLHLMERGDRG